MAFPAQTDKMFEELQIIHTVHSCVLHRPAVKNISSHEIVHILNFFIADALVIYISEESLRDDVNIAGVWPNTEKASPAIIGSQCIQHREQH